MPTWIQLVFLACGVCFILALKGLSGPKTARNGNLLGAAAAVVACLMPFFWTDLHLKHVPLIIIAIAIGTVGGVYGARTVQMTQMPQMVALFNGVGGGAAALVALLEVHDVIEAGWRPRLVQPRRRRVHRSPSVRSRSRARIVTFAKLQELMTVAAGGLPRPARHLRWLARRGRRARRSPRERPADVGRRPAGPRRPADRVCCWCCRSAAPTSRS